MKKVFLSLGLLIICSVIFYACKKDQVETVIPAYDEPVSIKDDRLAFRSIDDFENFINDSTKTNPDNPTARIASKKKASSDSLIEDEFLASLLNEKNIVEIGGKAYKLDFSEEKVYVLSDLTDENMILLENKNVSSGKLKVYSMDEPVLLIEQGEYESNNAATPNAKKKFCIQRGAKKRKTDNRVNGEWPLLKSNYYGGKPSNTASIGFFCMRAEAYNVYQKAGIYFSLFCKFKYFYDDNYPMSGCTQKGGYKNAKTYFEFNIAATYQPVCRDERTEDIWDTPAIGEECDHKRDSRVYGSIRPLRKYKMSSEVTYLFKGCQENYPPGTGSSVGTATPDCLIEGYNSCP
ncbi:MAG: hypothetical protein K2X86_08655 [Cytophagaceae bacterium]|nr:hypothetical protein [Cytophagaceae bacterium]